LSQKTRWSVKADFEGALQRAQLYDVVRGMVASKLGSVAHGSVAIGMERAVRLRAQDPPLEKRIVVVRRSFSRPITYASYAFSSIFLVN
jgi:hypothetical protein